MLSDKSGLLNALTAVPAFRLLVLLCAFTVLALPREAHGISNEGLVGHWTFNEGTGTIATDFSGNGLTGSFSDSPIWVNGKRGKALSFDGNDDYVSMSSVGPTVSTLSVAIWFRVSAFDADWQTLIAKGEGTNWRLSRNWDTNTLHISGLANETYDGTVPVNDGEWHHAVLTHDGAVLRLYIDGILDVENASAASPSAQSIGPFYIGSNPEASSRNWNGSLDEVRVYNRALTAAEVAELYRLGLALSKPPNNLGLVGYWSFNEGTSTVATDFSGNRNHGALNGPFDGILPTWVDGKLGKALFFTPDADDSVFLGTGVDITALPFSASVWVKLNAAGDGFHRAIIAKRDDFLSNQMRYQFHITPGNTVSLEIPSGTVEFGTFGVPKDVWVHLAVVATSTGSALYVNGSFREQGGPYTLGTDATAEVYIARTGDNFDYFEGHMDELRLYNRALTASEIARLYGTGAVKVGASSADLQRGSTLADGLVGHWTFDGADTGTTITDRSGQGNHGYFIGGATSSAKVIGKLGQAFDFDGANDYVNTLSAPSLDNLSALSVCAWTYVRAMNEQLPGIVEKSGDGLNGWIFYLNANAQGWGFLSPTNDSKDESNASSELTNAWQHLCATWSGANGASAITLYRNGVAAVANIQTSDAAGTLNDASNDLVIGIQAPEGAAHELDGILDDVRIYNRALTASEVKQLYQLGTVRITQ